MFAYNSSIFCQFVLKKVEYFLHFFEYYNIYKIFYESSSYYGPWLFFTFHMFCQVLLCWKGSVTQQANMRLRFAMNCTSAKQISNKYNSFHKTVTTNAGVCPSFLSIIHVLIQNVQNISMKLCTVCHEYVCLFWLNCFQKTYSHIKVTCYITCLLCFIPVHTTLLSVTINYSILQRSSW